MTTGSVVSLAFHIMQYPRPQRFALSHYHNVNILGHFVRHQRRVRATHHHCHPIGPECSCQLVSMRSAGCRSGDGYQVVGLRYIYGVSDLIGVCHRPGRGCERC